MIVLDASAVLAWLQREAGAEVVEPVLREAVMPAVSWSEVLQKAGQCGLDAGEVGRLLRGRGVVVEPVTEADAVEAARLWSLDGPPLSLADRLCLAVAGRLGAAALTAQRSWVHVGPRVRLIR